jgi:hypothetical protein
VIPEIGPLETPLDAEIEAEKARRAKDEQAKAARKAPEPEAPTIERHDFSVFADLDKLKHPKGGGISLESKRVVNNYIRRNKIPNEFGAVHGMAESRTLHGFDFDGIKIYYERGTKKNVVGSITDWYRESRGRGPLKDRGFELPKSLSESTNRIIFTAQKNKMDSFWAERYGYKNFTSSGTGGDGDIVFYGSKLSRKGAGVLSHEMGHNFAFDVYGHTHPPPGSRYHAAVQTDEPPVSNYAKNSVSEDFAEAVEMFVIQNDKMREVAPRRYQILADLFSKTGAEG